MCQLVCQRADLNTNRNRKLHGLRGKSGEPGGNRTLNPQIKSRFNPQKTFEIAMISRSKCADRGTGRHPGGPSVQLNEIEPATTVSCAGPIPSTPPYFAARGNADSIGAGDRRPQALPGVTTPACCVGCGHPFTPRRVGQVACSPGCRVRAWRRRAAPMDPAGTEISDSLRLTSTSVDLCVDSPVEKGSDPRGGKGGL